MKENEGTEEMKRNEVLHTGIIPYDGCEGRGVVLNGWFVLTGRRSD
jgi:hypothetical protein